jgi:hypothetical protein
MFSFKKRQNKKLEKFLKESHIELQDIQTYVPIFNKLKTKKRRFYKNLKIKLDHEIDDVVNYDPNNLTCSIKNVNYPFHIKQVPLIDTLDMFYGRLPNFDECLFLPNENSKDLVKKVNDPNNKAYTELLCSILLSQKHPYQFPVVLDYSSGIVNEYREVLDDDEISDDEEMDELLQNGYSIEKTKESDDDFTLIHPTMPVLIILQEKLDVLFDEMYTESLEQFLSDTNFPKLKTIRNQIFDYKMTSWVLQLLFALKSANDSINFVHNDLHIHNVMGKKTDKTYINIKYNNDAVYKIPTFGYIIKVIDFGRSTYSVNGLDVINDAFDKDSEAGDQYKNCTPSSAFDLSRFACSFFEDLEEEEVETVLKTNIGRIMHSWIFADDGTNLLEIEGFDLYIKIAENFRIKTPQHQIDTNEIFDRFKIEQDVQ